MFNSKTINTEFFKIIKKVMEIPDLDNNRLLVDIEQQKIYYINNHQEEIELEFKKDMDTGEYQIVNDNVLYEENNLTGSSNGVSEGKSLIKSNTSLPKMSGTDSQIHGQIQQAPKSAAFAKISILVFISILVSSALAALILLLK